MIVNKIILASNPFIDAYIHSDFLGRMIFIGLILLSVCTWIILIHKVWITHRARKFSSQFRHAFQLHTANPLAIECETLPSSQRPNPFLDIYLVLKKHTINILNKNRSFGFGPEVAKEKGASGASYLSP